MSNLNEFKHRSAKSLDTFPKLDIKASSIYLIKDFLLSQPEQIKNLEHVSTTLYEVINKFVEITKDYSSQLEILALSIIPNNSTEGQLAQAVQSILLFYLESLNNLMSELQKAIVKTNEKEIDSIINQINEYNNDYLMKIKEVNLKSKNYEKEVEFYQEYLVNKEYDEHIKRGDLRNYDDEIINNNERSKLEKIKNENNKKEEKNFLYDFDIIEEKDYFKEFIKEATNNFKSYNSIDVGLNDTDNEKELITSEKNYITKIDESNNLLKCIKKYLSQEKTNLRKNIFKMCDCFIEGLLKCAKAQKENCDIQNEVIKNLKNILNYEEKDKNQIVFKPINLKYLEIYDNFKKEKNESEFNDNEKNNSNINISNKKMKNKRTSLDFSGRNIIGYNQIFNNIINEEMLQEKFKNMVITLNRDEILKIFEKIKNTKINLSENDLKLIEQESNYKIIHEIIVKIFINTENYTEKDKKIIIDYFEKDKIYIFYFIRILNDHRTKGKFIISEHTLKYLGELFEFINNLILSKNDMELFKFLFILSMTYYYFSEKDNSKIYLFSYIKDHPDYQKVKFWEEYLHELINHDLKGNNFNQTDLSNKKIDQLNREEKEKLKNCYFSNFLSVTKAMADFRMDKQFVRDFVEKNKEKYILSNEQIENICMIFDVSLRENEKDYNGDLNKEKINKLNDKENKEENKDNKENKLEDNKENEYNKNNEEDIEEDNKEKNKENKEDNKRDNKENKKEIKDENKNVKEENKDNKDDKNINYFVDKKNINIEDNSEFDNENNQTNNETIK